MKKRTNKIGANNRTFFDKRGSSLVFIGLIILTGSLFLNQRIERPQDVDWFRDKKIRDEYSAPKEGSFASNVTLPLQFSLIVPNEQRKIKVVFRYRCVDQCVDLWLRIPSKEGFVPIQLLLQHEILKKYRYPSVSSNGMTLFQREINYPTIDEFIAHRPTDTITYTEKTLQLLFPNLDKGVSNLENLQSAEFQPDYILTSYLKPRIFPENWYEFGRVFDVRGAIRDKNGAISVELMTSQSNGRVDLTKPELVLMN